MTQHIPASRYIQQKGDERTVEQIMGQLEKLVSVVMIKRLEAEQSVESELCLIKVVAEKETRSEIIQIVDIFQSKDYRRLAAVADD